MSFEHPHLHPGPPGHRTLRARVAEEGPLFETAVLRMARELAEALSWLHAAGRNHGRLTPDAVYFDAQGRAVLALEAPAADNDKGWVPFEQGAGKAAPASDLYQLGAALLFAASGKEPVSTGLPLAYRTPPELAAFSAPGRELVEWLVEPRWDRRPSDAAAVARDAVNASQGRPNARRARRTAARGLVAGGVALAVLAIGFGLRSIPPVEPQRPRPVAEPVRPAVQERPPVPRVSLDWNAVAGPYPDVMTLARDPGGAVLVFTKYEIHSFPAGRPESGRLVTSPLLSKTKELLGRHREERYSYATGHLASDGRVWGGAFDGRVEGYPAGVSNKSIIVPALEGSSRVDALAWRAGTLYAAHRGRLMSWKEGAPGWTAAGFPSGASPAALVVAPNGALFAGGRGGVWREEGGAWTRVWEGPAEGDEVRFLGFDEAGSLLVGTRDGLVILGADFSEAGRYLRGAVVTSAASGPDGRLWVGTWNGGLHARIGGAWYAFGYAQGLPDDTVSGVAVDGSGLLWVGLYGHGVVIRTEAEAAAAARSAPAPARLNGELFSSLPEAVHRKLTVGRADGDVAFLELGGLDYVYFGGRQVWPRGVGALGPDGTSARRGEGGRWVIRGGDGSDRVLPPMPGGSNATAALVDSRGRLWVGTDRAGLNVFEDGAWTTHAADAGLDNNPVYALAEDAAGALWTATSPFFDAKVGRYARKNLHRFDGNAWRHWSPAEGLGYWSTSDVRALADGSVAVATNGGVSVLKDGTLRSLQGADGKDALRAKALAPLAGGALLALDPNGGLTVSDKDFARRVSSRSGLFTDQLSRAAVDGDGDVWLLASDGRVFVTPLRALREGR